MSSVSASHSTVYLVTGANRGIGLAIVEQLLLKPNIIVFAGVRDPKTATALKPSERLHLLKVVSSDVKGNKEAVEQIKSIAGKLDVVIANAGISNKLQTALETEPSVMAEHFNINTIGPLVLFQTTYSLLVASANPKFIVISSGAGSIETGTTYPMTIMSYGTSKAAVNYVTKKIYSEHPEILAFPISPGAVDTDMATYTISIIGNPGFDLITPEQSGKAVVELVENATREKEGGQFMNYDGGKWAW